MMKSFCARLRNGGAVPLAATAVALGLAAVVAVAGQFEVPPLTGPVVDRANMVPPRLQGQIEQSLRFLLEQGGAQVQVLTVPDLAGLEIEQASIQVVDQWKLGSESADNGVLLMVAAKERKIRIEVGQGLEGQLTDAYSGRIIRDVMTPLFKSGHLGQGILLGVYRIAQITDPNIKLDAYLEGAAQYRPRRSERVGRGTLSSTIIFIIFGLIFVSRFGLLGGLLLGAGMRRGGYGGGFGGGGGGWSGGGGGFSGGGASGGW